MKTLQLTNEMVERLQHFYNLPEYGWEDDSEYESAMELVQDLARELNNQ